MHSRRESQPVGTNRRRVVAIGGGTGLPRLASGLRELAPHTVDIAAIVTTFDDGGSSGILRAELGIPALGDLRRCLMALAEPDEVTTALRAAMGHRFDANSSLSGHSLGNLVITGLLSRNGGELRAAVADAAQLLQIRGSVIPVATEPGHLRAQLEDGTWIESETEIDNRTMVDSPISQLALREPITPNPDAVTAVQAAELITIGPGDLYTSILPNLLPDGMARAVRESDATVVYVCNISNKPAETNGYTVSDYIRTVNRYIGSHRIDVAIYHAEAGMYAEQGQSATPDLNDAATLVSRLFIGNYADPEAPHLHEPKELAATVLQILEECPD